ncbi:hypothetical protein EBR66_05615 [bacterium]|nr:hypothetical protein [bacterium]
MHTRAFTLIETVLYLALFSALLGGLFMCAYMLIDSADRSQTKAMMQAEKQFILATIDRALTGASAIATTTPPNAVTITHLDGTVTKFCAVGTNIVQLVGAGTCSTRGVALNNSNVTISKLTFLHTYNPMNPSIPEKLEAGFTIHSFTSRGMPLSQTASTTRYVRR